MRKYDWKRDGTEHLERKGCIINIKEDVNNEVHGPSTAIEIISDKNEAKYVIVSHTGHIIGESK